MTGPAIGTKIAVEVAKSAAGILPDKGKVAVLDHILTGITPEALKALSPKGREKLLHALANSEDATCATLPDAPTTTAGRIEMVERHASEGASTAVGGTVTVNGKQFDTLLFRRSNLSMPERVEYAKSLGYRFATREEQQAYVGSLLAKEEANTINEAEKNALETYRERYVRDAEGGLFVEGRHVCSFSGLWRGSGIPPFGALFVRPFAESK